MDDLSRSEYPDMLNYLNPGTASVVLQDRVKRIGRTNQEIADWLQERRKVEDQYVAGLRKLLQLRAPNPASELGVFQPAWDGILRSVENIASSHQLYSQRVEQDVEAPLRAFQLKKEMTNMTTISGNITAMSKELEEARDKLDKACKKSGRGNSHKVEAASAKLDSATQQWEAQAPFIFETLQAVDEQRVNHLRDVLTQLETHEVDQATRDQASAEGTLNIVLELKTDDEIQSFARRMTAGKAKMEKRATNRQPSITGSSTGPSQPMPPPTSSSQSSQPLGPPIPAISHASTFAVTPSSRNEDDISEHSGAATESKLRSRIGTMLGRRRQSIHAGFGPLSPSKGTPFGAGLGAPSSHGRPLSPLGSVSNLSETNNRLSSLAESPGSPVPPSTADTFARSHAEGTTNGNHTGTNGVSSGAPPGSSAGPDNASDDVFGVPPPPGPPPSHVKDPAAASAEPLKDAEGFTVPARMNDPISQAQRDASALGDDAEPAFKLNIQNEPVADEDAAAKKAAMSSVANTLSMAMPSRKAGTVRGRRDVRNTIYVPAPVPSVPESFTSPGLPRSPTSSTVSKPAALAALTSETSLAGTSDTQSIRSATTSLGGLAHLKHPELTQPGLNASIIETVSANFVDGELVAVKVAGEIAFAYNPTDDVPAKEITTIRVNNMDALEAIGPNRIFVHNTSSRDQFTLNTTHLHENKPTVGFTFRAFTETATALGEHCPLAIRPVWKPTGDKLGLLLQYRLNPASSLAQLGQGVTLHNVVLIATYEGARASGAQTKPTGTHVKDKHLVYWRLGDVALTDAWVKIVCRIIGQQGAEPQPGHIEARWEYAVPAGATAGALGFSLCELQADGGKGKGKTVEDEDADPFADETAASPQPEGDWVEVPAARQIVGARYEAK